MVYKDFVYQLLIPGRSLILVKEDEGKEKKIILVALNTNTLP